MVPSTCPPASGAYVSLRYIRPLLDQLVQRHIALTPVLQVLGVQAEQLDEPDLYIDAVAERQAFELAAKLSGDVNIGLHAGQRMRAGHLGALGHLLMSCVNAQALFDLHHRFVKLVSNGSFPDYQLDGQHVVLTLHVNWAEPGQAPRHPMEFNLAGWTSLGRWLAGHDFTPQRIDWPFAKPEDTREQEAFFECPMQYGCAHLRVVYDKALMDRPFLNCYPGLRGPLEEELSRRLPQEDASPSIPKAQANKTNARHEGDAMLGRIHQNLVFMLPKGAPDLGSLADAMQLSRRALQRQLEERGTSFSEMLDQARRKQAAVYVARPDLPLPEVASLLGFAEQSALQRAFKRWFGCTPGEFRRRGGLTAVLTAQPGTAGPPSPLKPRSATTIARPD